MRLRIMFLASIFGTIAFASASALSPPMVDNVYINGVALGEVVEHTFTQHGGTPSITWDNLTFVEYLPFIPGSTNPPFRASFDPDNQLFIWDTTGFARGAYVWSVRASNDAGSDTGTLTIQTFIPEPASASLIIPALMGFAGTYRRRPN